MQSRKLHLAWGLATAAVLVLAGILLVRSVVEVLLMILVGAALVGMYLLRRYARAELLYLRHVDTPPASRREPEPTRDAVTVDRGDQFGSDPPAATGARTGRRAVHS
jgi:hypothetical protein